MYDSVSAKGVLRTISLISMILFLLKGVADLLRYLYDSVNRVVTHLIHPMYDYMKIACYIGLY